MAESFFLHLPALPVLSLLALTAFAGGVMRGFSGFGAGLLIAPVFVLVMSPTDVVVIILLLNLATIIPLFREALRHVQWAMVWRIFIPSLIGLPIGLAMLQFVNPDIMRKTIAGIVSVTAIFMLAGWVYKGRRGRLQEVLAGGLSGLMTSIGGIGGPPLALYLLSDPNLKPAVFRSFCLMFFLLAQICTLTPLALTGKVTLEQMSLTAALLPLYVAANIVGAVVHRRTAHHEAKVRRACLLFLLAVGIVTFLI